MYYVHAIIPVPWGFGSRQIYGLMECSAAYTLIHKCGMSLLLHLETSAHPIEIDWSQWGSLKSYLDH